MAYSRQFYNDSVLSFNNMITTVPGMFFKGSRSTRSYLEIDVAEKAMPKVQF
ncbi:MAG TPA: LemA family protein [Candidatus Nanoarchaeia archaeon]|nr:LemA family protein [Candidatus Nanoarchaeia archaeon]